MKFDQTYPNEGSKHTPFMVYSCTHLSHPSYLVKQNILYMMLQAFFLKGRSYKSGKHDIG